MIIIIGLFLASLISAFYILRCMTDNAIVGIVGSLILAIAGMHPAVCVILIVVALLIAVFRK